MEERERSNVRKPGLGHLERHGHNTAEWHLVTDSMGRPVGKYKSDHQPLQADVEVIRQFLINVSKQRKEQTMAERSRDDRDSTNLCYIAGVLKFDPKSYENNVSALVDVGLKAAIPISVFIGNDAPRGNDEIARKLKAFREGDYIKTVCMLRPYGVKKGDTWNNKLSIDVTAIKNDPPRREDKRRQQSDDDIPY